MNAAVRDLFAPGLDNDSYIGRVFAFISRLLPTDLIGYGVLDQKSKQLDANFDNHPPHLRESLEAYGRMMHRYEPFRFDPRANGGKPYSMRDYFTRRELRNLDLYQEVHAPMGFEDHCYVNVKGDPGISLYLGLFRAGGEFRSREKELLRLSQPHLANARNLALAHSSSLDVPLTPDLFSHAGFTPKESEIIYWLTQGKSNVEISLIQRIRTDTVSSYLRTIYEKMGVENRVAATVHALHLARKYFMQARQMTSGGVFLKTPTY